MSATSPYVVSADWLQERLGKPGLSIVDGSWYLPAHGRDARAEYQAGHIPGAVFFDHDRVVEPGSASTKRTRSSSMTGRASMPRRGCGGCSG
jgi:thiosulfate/3-mercaptopyruvate sulfurtransferase